VDTSHMVESGYWETKKEWVDTSHMVYQGYWKDVTKSVWVDTSQWVSSGYWKDVTERVWVTSGYTAYRDVKKWVNTSHNELVSSGYWGSKWVDTSHWETRSYNVWVSSGYWAGYWVNTSHWETRYRDVRQAYSVWVSSGYWRYNSYGRRYWVDTSHWETRYRTVRQAYSVWVSSGYWGSKWVNTSHWETRSYNVWVSSGHWASYWVDTSHWTWVNSGYWKTDKEAYWVDTSHWEDQKVWVEGGHYETRYREVEDWQPCNVVKYEHIGVYWWSKYIPGYELLDKWMYEFIRDHPWFSERYTEYLKNIIKNFDGKLYKCEVWSYFVPFANEPNKNYDQYLEYRCYEVLNWKKESYSVWVPGGHWKREWVDTSHWVESGYWQSYSYKTWVDTSYLKSEGHWETKKEWVDTSHMVESGYWEYYTKRTWVDTSHWETRDVWVDTSHWVEADLDPEGKVLHTDKWNENRINYNLSVSGDPDKPRGYEIFFNGEKFVLEADTLGDFQPESVHVEFLGTKFETDLTNTGDSKWEGYIWDDSFIYFHDRDCVFRFTASYNYNGDKFEIEDELTVYIVRDFYWELHRGF